MPPPYTEKQIDFSSHHHHHHLPCLWIHPQLGIDSQWTAKQRRRRSSCVVKKRRNEPKHKTNGSKNKTQDIFFPIVFDCFFFTLSLLFSPLYFVTALAYRFCVFLFICCCLFSVVDFNPVYIYLILYILSTRENAFKPSLFYPPRVVLTSSPSSPGGQFPMVRPFPSTPAAGSRVAEKPHTTTYKLSATMWPFLFYCAFFFLYTSLHYAPFLYHENANMVLIDFGIKWFLLFLFYIGRQLTTTTPKMQTAIYIPYWFFAFLFIYPSSDGMTGALDIESAMRVTSSIRDALSFLFFFITCRYNRGASTLSVANFPGSPKGQLKKGKEKRASARPFQSSWLGAPRRREDEGDGLLSIGLPLSSWP